MNKYFGTDGIRGKANVELTPTLAFKIGRYLGEYHNKKKRNTVLIGRDTRISGSMLLHSIVAGLLSSGTDVVDLGVTTTPSVVYLTKKHKFNYGIIITASHNPYYDNGIKVINENGDKISQKLEHAINEYLNKEEDDLPLKKEDDIGTYTYNGKLLLDYVDLIKANIKITSNLNILFDLANGAASKVAPLVLKDLAINNEIINAMPNGININASCGSTYLETLSSKIKERKDEFDLGVAFDGDGDRVLLVDKDGNKLDGDHIIFIAARCMQKLGKLNKNTVVLTVMSNLGLLNALKKEGIKYEIVDVGDKYVQAKINEEGYSLGGEQSGHIIFGNLLNSGDGLLTILYLLTLLEEAKLTIEEALNGFAKLPQVLINVNVSNKNKVMKDEGLLKLAKKITTELGTNGRLLLRASGTEPKIRIMVEAETVLKCEHYCDLVKQYIEAM